MRTTSDIRSSFLSFFKHQGHTEVPSSPLIPRNDPTLLFTAAGMVQFKDIFTGKEKSAYSRAVTAQKCLRAGGKHNDLDNVGYTARHHTFFEMLGNFSFGNYFKEEAIKYAWDFVTQELKLPKERLVITVYAEDEDAARLWRKIAGFSDDKILRISTSDNFWSAGDTGPCGPCSEIFYDHGPEIPGGPPGIPEADGDRFVEIWNLVFMQFDQVPDQNGQIKRVALPNPSIDTGMGLERTTAILQGVHSNYQIDLFQALIHACSDLTGIKAQGDLLPSFRVIADHMRASCFLMADGILPSNEGRGYVLRRIMRRAMRHVQLLGVKDPLLYKLVQALNEQMGGVYPELIRAEALITETLYLEETRFQETLERGIKLLKEEVERLSPSQALSGEVAFRLYDTYGFPLDLTQDALKSQGRQVDVAGFERAMEKQRQDARAAWAGSGESKTETIWFQTKEKAGTTDFLGYDTLEAEGLITALIQDGKEVSQVSSGAEVYLSTNQTPFYGESGGQVGDTGTIMLLDGEGTIRVEDTQKKVGDLIVHKGVVEQGILKVGQAVCLKVDKRRRAALQANHSATHLLQAALQKILGGHVTQKGSLVAPDRLRFDFSHTKALTFEEIEKVESWVNTAIRENVDVLTRLMSPEAAMEKGAMALFGEKYGSEVRVVAMGRAKGESIFQDALSVELCGGTHVARTGDIGIFKIILETSVASGVRRLEAVTGEGAEKFIRKQSDTLREVSLLLKTNPEGIQERVNALLLEKKKLEKDLQQTLSQSTQGEEVIKKIGSISLCILEKKGVPAKDLKSLVDQAKKQIGSGIVLCLSVEQEKVSIVVGVTEDLASQYNAIDLVKVAAQAVGGQGGGGRPDLAQAGGSDITKIPALKENIERLIEEGLRKD